MVLNFHEKKMGFYIITNLFSRYPNQIFRWQEHYFARLLKLFKILCAKFNIRINKHLLYSNEWKKTIAGYWIVVLFACEHVMIRNWKACVHFWSKHTWLHIEYIDLLILITSFFCVYLLQKYIYPFFKIYRIHYVCLAICNKLSKATKLLWWNL